MPATLCSAAIFFSQFYRWQVFCGIGMNRVCLCIRALVDACVRVCQEGEKKATFLILQMQYLRYILCYITLFVQRKLFWQVTVVFFLFSCAAICFYNLIWNCKDSSDFRCVFYIFLKMCVYWKSISKTKQKNILIPFQSLKCL